MVEKVYIKFNSYVDIFPDIFLNSVLRKHGKKIFNMKLNGKDCFVLEGVEEIISECEKILSNKDSFTDIRSNNTFTNQFNYYYETGCLNENILGNIEKFYNFVKNGIKKVKFTSICNLLEDEKVCKFALTVKSLFSFITRNKIKSANVYYLPLIDYLLDESIPIDKYSVDLFKRHEYGYKWIVDVYLPVIEHLENNAPKIDLQSYFYQVEMLSEENSKYIKPLVSLYIGMDDKGYLYPFYRLGKTGRIYTSYPNIQCFSKEIENEIFVPNYNFHRFDFPHFEVSVIAYLSGDPKLNNILNRGFDVYYYLIHKIHGKPYADIINHSDTESVRKLRKEIKKYFITSLYNANTDELTQYGFQKLMWWKKQMIRKFYEDGKVFTLFGRYRKTEKLEQAINYPVQSFGSDISMYTCKKLIDSGYTVRLYKHDEFLVDSNKELPNIKTQEIIREIEPF